MDTFNLISEKTEVKSEPRDIDMRKRRRESESYSPTRPDYKPTIKTEGKVINGYILNYLFVTSF